MLSTTRSPTASQVRKTFHWKLARSIDDQRAKKVNMAADVKNTVPRKCHVFDCASLPCLSFPTCDINTASRVNVTSWARGMRRSICGPEGQMAPVVRSERRRVSVAAKPQSSATRIYFTLADEAPVARPGVSCPCLGRCIGRSSRRSYIARRKGRKA